MAKVLLVDGYNVINRIPELRPFLNRGLEEARTQLVFVIDKWRISHPGSECIIIFYGDHKTAMPLEQRISGIRCIFSASRHGGDDEIIKYVRNNGARASSITVVSDDNSVRNSCRSLGASVQPSSFIVTKKASPSSGPRRVQPSSKGISKRVEDEITREYGEKLGLLDKKI